MKNNVIHDEIVTEMNSKINTLNNKIKYDKLIKYLKSEDSIPLILNGFNRSLDSIRKIMDGSIDLQKVKENQ